MKLSKDRPTYTAILLIGVIAIGLQQQSMGFTATLAQLKAGQFHTALDKRGTGGAVVSVLNLRVLYVQHEDDGDYHVAVTDRSICGTGLTPPSNSSGCNFEGSIFITEIIPSHPLTIPRVGSVIDITGIVYCDNVLEQNEDQAWHGYSCWEIHPILQWKESSDQSLYVGDSFFWENASTYETVACCNRTFTPVVQVSSIHGGTVEVYSSAINRGIPVMVSDGVTRSFAVPEGSKVILSAIPNPGYHFGNWTGSYYQLQAQLTVRATNNSYSVASFVFGP
ncbi:MAG: hypothetical protein HY247_03970 [archaeon]|nr:MAG: hypothetical protein HY247_03970 [archaeon]